ncbi:hypothetical protein GCM10010259_69220 [Streptomyces daghestanicus]|uniref:Uncharacterized protein n=1 Tax=Streptomyces daghestanicus TaxID=66885 RepID=A0ABQ3Q7A7_9ACTN|nr:hypothetical protein GCM10010259_69220 [Streptomyces daghestanicus]GHI33163.1 hypothetical protein Sdagh_48930 [Streptomyces daghestanicus]
MVTSRLRDPDRPCVLPGDPSWLHEVRYLEEKVLRVVAAAASVAAFRFDEDRYVLSVGVLEGAASVIGRLAAEMEEPADDEREGIRVLFLPGWELDYLWQVLTVFRRAQAGEPEAADLRELLDGIGEGQGRTVEQITEDVQRVAAMLMLDIPAVCMLTAAALHPLGLPPGHTGLPPDADAVREAYEQVRAGWAAAGVR